MLFGSLALGLSACGTADQPNYAEAYQAKNLQVQLEEREFTLSSTSPMDGALAIEMLSINEQGELLLRTEFGIDKYRKDDRRLLNGNYIVLLRADPALQEARLKTWEKPVF